MSRSCYPVSGRLSDPSVGVLDICDVTFMSLTSDYGGAIYLSGSATQVFTVERCSMVHCRAGSIGGAIYAAISQASINISKVCGFDCASGTGAYAYFSAGGSKTLEFNMVSLNRCPMSDAGTPYYPLLLNYGNHILNSCNVSYAYFSHVTVKFEISSSVKTTMTNFESNFASNSIVIWVCSVSSLSQFSLSNFINNTQINLVHGTIHLSGSQGIMTDCCCCKNNFQLFQLDSGSSLTVVRCVLNHDPNLLFDRGVDTSNNNVILLTSSYVSNALLLYGTHWCEAAVNLPERSRNWIPDRKISFMIAFFINT